MMIVKENGHIYMAKIALIHLCAGHSDVEWCLNEENSNVCRLPNDDNIIVALDGPNASFISDLLRYEPDFIRGEVTIEKLILEVAPALKDFLQDCGKLDKKGSMGADIAIAQKDRAFIITDNFHCNEVEEFDAIGRNENTLNTTLYLSKGLSPEERFCYSAKTLEKLLSYDRLPLIAINTETCKPYFIERKD